MIPVIVLLLLAFTNLGYLYAFFLKQRHKQITIMRICGATKTRVILLILAEMLVIVIGMFIIAALAFKFLSPLIYKNSTLPFLYSLNIWHYIMVFCAVTVASVIFFLPTINNSSDINLSECKEA
ncbi:MAG: FtsX-like permease family protein [Clostridiales bacterium]|nr:FtsX-like permease family protein [Clostridiales bacterium]